MNVLFCSDAMVVDGVASFVFHLSTALREGGHRVAVLGRWAGKGFQERLRKGGVEVIQCLSPTVGNFWFDKKAVEFSPHVIVTDSRRSFPLATRLKAVTGARVFTFFLDKLEKTDRKGRDVASLVQFSDAWLSAEKPLLEQLENVPTPFPKYHFRRPLKGLIRPTPLPPKTPFRLLCFGRLGGFKSITAWSLLRDAADLKKQIPSLEMIFVGGGWRTVKFRLAAGKIHREARSSFIRVLGTQTDPQPWFEWATLVCAGSTAAIEAALAHRPVVASAAHWLGLLTPENIEEGFSTYFAERLGPMVRDDPAAVGREVLRVYSEWDERKMDGAVLAVRKAVEPRFEREGASEEFQRIYDEISRRTPLSGNG